MPSKKSISKSKSIANSILAKKIAKDAIDNRDMKYYKIREDLSTNDLQNSLYDFITLVIKQYIPWKRELYNENKPDIETLIKDFLSIQHLKTIESDITYLELTYPDNREEEFPILS